MNPYIQIKNELQNLAGEGVAFSLDTTENPTHGDYATNIAFVTAKEKGAPAKQYAEELVPVLTERLSSIVEKVEVAGPGFINFFLKDEVIREGNANIVIDIKSNYFGKAVLVEHSSPNLFKPFHIGHLMNNVIGTFITRAMQTGGAKVQEMSFPSDVSLGIAKGMYILLENKKQGIDLEAKSFDEQIIYFGEVYTRGVAYFDEHPDELQKAKDIAHIIFDDSSLSEEYRIYNFVKEKNIEYFVSILQSLGSHMLSDNGIILESTAGNRGKKIVTDNTGDDKVFTQSQGAVIYTPDETRKDLHTAVFINSEGYPTYEAKDLGLIDLKFEKYNPDYSFTVTDQEQVSHFKVVEDAALRLGDTWQAMIEKSVHMPHGRMLFKGAKMSSRLGGVPLALDVINVVEEEVKERAGEKIANLSDDDREKLEREIALSALRIAVLRSKPGININFDPETSLSFEGDSGPYLLYTHARCSSLLEKNGFAQLAWSVLPVTSLEKKLFHFEEELVHICNELAPQQLVAYLFSIAQLFNAYYAITQILVDGDEAGNAHRLMIVKRTKEVLRKGLFVLGVEAPERM